MWRIIVVTVLILCGGCASQRAKLPGDDIILPTSEAFFAKPPTPTFAELSAPAP